VKTWPEMRRQRSPCWVGLCKPRNTESGPGRASSSWPRWRDQQADSWEGALGSEDLGAWRPGLCQSWPWSYRQWRKRGKPQIPGSVYLVGSFFFFPFSLFLIMLFFFPCSHFFHGPFFFSLFLLAH
jgi:hypothetical protein